MAMASFKIKGIQSNLIKNTNKLAVARNGINFGGVFYLPTKGKRVVIKPLKYGIKEFFVSIEQSKIVVQVDEECIVRYFKEFVTLEGLQDLTKLNKKEIMKDKMLDEVYFRSKGTMFVEFKNEAGFWKFKERF